MRFLPLSFVIKHTLGTLEKIQCGSLSFTTPDGRHYEFRGQKPGPCASMVLYDWAVARNAMMRGDIALGEDYVSGLWDTDSVENVFSLFIKNMETFEDDFAHGDWLRRLGFVVYNRIIRRNSKRGSRQNIEAHYDVGNDFYQLWLDDTMTYSSAIFEADNDELDKAQRTKYGRILNRIDGAAKSLLEIGCGWGGFAEEAAKQARHVTGLTISPSQHAFASERLKDSADIRLQDYRDIDGKFDAIVSIEMFEAVGEKYWPVYFKTLSDRLKSGGKAMIQTITIQDAFFEGYRKRSDFIRHYVFPGGMLPSTARFSEEAAKAGLKATDCFSFGQDYAQTLREWLKRFDLRKQHIFDMGYSEAFVRNWRFYLGLCAAGFASSRTDVVQIELSHA